MSAYHFSVFKRNDRPYFLVSFKDDARNYLPPVVVAESDFKNDFNDQGLTVKQVHINMRKENQFANTRLALLSFQWTQLLPYQREKENSRRTRSYFPCL